MDKKNVHNLTYFIYKSIGDLLLTNFRQIIPSYKNH